MSSEARQALKTILLVTLVVAALVALAWWSMADLVFGALAALLGLVVGWRLGYRYGSSRAEQARRVRPRSSPGPRPAKRKAK